ncbi:MAG: hypothetical protein KC478_12000 [Bacteriovoracaceae bacterium]|nr:hypothetical protein [Bacteriovoracaceae bacterium]
MKKKELKWTFEVVKVPEEAIPAYAICVSSTACYFTRPLYDEESEFELDKKQGKRQDRDD